MPAGGRGAESSGEFSLRRRLQVLVASLVAVIVAAGVIALLIIDARDQALDTIVFRLDPAASAALQLDASLVDQQAAVNGFVLVQREDILEPFQRARSREEAALDSLDERLAGTDLATMVPGVRQAIREWRTDVVEPQLSSIRVRPGGRSSGLGHYRPTALRRRPECRAGHVRPNYREAVSRAGVVPICPAAPSPRRWRSMRWSPLFC